eukprot:TRINITY_DN2040_c0_g1_i2.p1 TRINITY_DN2040_c0_g1~~TRINITY_DN2040_c0_g1_i2.p1  ORF type:complete len:152 (+),score=17.49 TRINITY_DN2040_c0_g1_i2:183-638(+)
MINMEPSSSSSSYLNQIASKVRSLCRYYTGYPKDLGPSRVIEFQSERQFVQLLHEGYPVVVAFTIKCPYTQHLDKMLEEAAAEFYPNIRFMRVECPKYPGFCIARQRKDYPFIEIFHSPVQFNYDTSPYGFREFFKRHGMSPQAKMQEKKP